MPHQPRGWAAIPNKHVADRIPLGTVSSTAPFVELVKRYSKPEYQGKRLRRMVELVEKSVKAQVRTPEPLPQTQRVDRRLSAETITELVQVYQGGVSTTELRRRYELSQGSVIKTLHEHDVVMRGQGLASDQVPVAAELYLAVSR
jgi:hypothetical protein